MTGASSCAGQPTTVVSMRIDRGDAVVVEVEPLAPMSVRAGVGNTIAPLDAAAAVPDGVQESSTISRKVALAVASSRTAAPVRSGSMPSTWPYPTDRSLGGERLNETPLLVSGCWSPLPRRSRGWRRPPLRLQLGAHLARQRGDRTRAAPAVDACSPLPMCSPSPSRTRSAFACRRRRAALGWQLKQPRRERPAPAAAPRRRGDRPRCGRPRPPSRSRGETDGRTTRRRR